MKALSGAGGEKMNKEKKVRKLSERIFAIGLSIICEVAFLLWLLQPCSDATLLLLGFGSAMFLYWSLDWFEKLLLKRLEKKEKGWRKIKNHSRRRSKC